MFRDLRFFKQVCEDKSVRKAARALFITPQGLSKALKNLEQELGAQLFHRASDGMELTESGRLVLNSVDGILAELDAMRAALTRLRGEISGTLPVPCAFGVISALSTEFISDYRQKYPNVALELADYPDLTAEELLRDGKAELCITLGPVDRESFTGVHLLSRRMCLIMHKKHRLAGRPQVSFSEMKDEKWIFVNDQFKNHHSIMENCAGHGFYPQIDLSVAEISLVHKYARLHGSVGITVDYVVDDLYHEDTVSVPIADDSWHGWDVYVIARKNQPLSLAAESFFHHVCEFDYARAAPTKTALNLV